MAFPIPILKFREFDGNGNPLAGGKLYSYRAGTTTPLVTYSDPDGITPNTNPVILDSEGRADVYLGNDSYKFVLKDANDVTIYTQDDVTPAAGSVSGDTSPWTTHEVTDGQAATDLDGETVDFADYSSAEYAAEIIRGTTVIANGRLAIQNLNGTARVVLGGFIANEAHGVTFSVSLVGTVAQLKAALDSGAGNGTIKLSRRLIPA